MVSSSSHSCALRSLWLTVQDGDAQARSRSSGERLRRVYPQEVSDTARS